MNNRQQACATCKGVGRIRNFSTPIFLSAVGIGMGWYGWASLPTLLEGRGAVHNDFVLFCSIVGPGIVIYGWWKEMWTECCNCGGSGYKTASAATTGLAWSASATLKISADQLCHNCDYNLRTRRIGDRCPECGEEILNPPEADERREAKKSLRSGLILAVAFPVGMVTSMLLFGTLGALWFVGAWAALGGLLWIISTLNASKNRPS